MGVGFPGSPDEYLDLRKLSVKANKKCISFNEEAGKGMMM
jgi:hypothetical protein